MPHPTREEQISPTQSVPLILTFCSISAMFIYLICSKNLVFGSEPGGWFFPYFDPTPPLPLWIPLTVFILLAGMVFAGSRTIRKHEILTLVACFGMAVLIQVLMQRIYPVSMDALIVNDETNSFYSAALKVSPYELISRYPDLVDTLPGHAKTNMPGKTLFFHLLFAFTSSPQVMGYLTIAVSTVGGVFLYGISKRLFHDPSLALFSFVLYALIPCKQAFFPILNTVTPVLILACLFLLLVYLDSKKAWFLVLLGIGLYSLVLFEPSPLVTGLLFVAVLLRAYGKKQVTLKEMFLVMCVPVISFIATYLIFRLFFSYDLFQSLRYMVIDAVEFNGEDQRSYWIWIVENTKEFFYGAGLPTMLVFVYLGFQQLSHWRDLRKNILNWSTENLYYLGLLVTYAVVLFLGINRGETTRLWIYLAVFFQVPAAWFLARVIQKNALVFLFMATLAMQTMFTLQRVMFLSR